MATYYLLNTIKTPSGDICAGSIIDDTVENLTMYEDQDAILMVTGAWYDSYLIAATDLAQQAMKDGHKELCDAHMTRGLWNAFND